jgi:hypothetical protein
MYNRVDGKNLERLKKIIYANLEIPDAKKEDVDEWWNLIEIVEDA